MSANLATNAAGQAMVAYVGETPWHKQGTPLEEGCTGMEMLQAASMDFDVVECPAFANLNGTLIEIPDMKATLRGDTNGVLGIVGKDYKVFQNRQMVSFFEGLVQGHQIKYDTAGALGLGERCWVLAEIPSMKFAIKGDDMLTYMLICNSHDGSMNLRCTPTSVRVVCANTLNMASVEFIERHKKYGKGIHGGYKIRHTKNMQKAVDQAIAAYNGCLKDAEATKALYEILANKPVTDTEVRAYFLKTIATAEEAEKVEADKASKAKETRRENKVTELVKIYNSPTNQTGTRGTAFAAYNSVVEFVDFSRDTRCLDGRNDNQCRFESAMFGSGQVLKDKAFVEALALV